MNTLCTAHIPAVWLLLAAFREDDTAGLALLTADPNKDTPEDEEEEEEKEKDGAPLDASAPSAELSTFWPKLKETPGGAAAAGLSAAASSLSLNEKGCGAAPLTDALAAELETEVAAALDRSRFSTSPSDVPLPYFLSMLARCRS